MNRSIERNSRRPIELYHPIRRLNCEIRTKKFDSHPPTKFLKYFQWELYIGSSEKDDF